MEGVDVVIVGCGVPKRSMGWVHLHQLLNLQVFSDVHTIQVSGTASSTTMFLCQSITRLFFRKTLPCRVNSFDDLNHVTCC